ncbi:cytochrome P450 [Streptomyces sp. NPDC006326]|uniref:cytochrome P450 n=1 Tax=Streptomyces sp. NPDC006326 TaxID=3156752 RepID=UPI0033B7AE8B
MRTLHEAALGVLRRPGGHGREPSRAGPAVTAGPRASGAARAGRAETVRFAAARALPLLGRGFAGPRPVFSPDTLRSLRARHGGAPVLVRGLTGNVLVLLDPQELRQFYAEPAGAGAGPVPPVCPTLQAVLVEEARRLSVDAVLDLGRVREAVARTARRIALGDRAGAAEEPVARPGPLRRRDRARAALADVHDLPARAARRLAAPGAAGAVGPAAARVGPSPAGTAGAGAAVADAAGRCWVRAMDAIPATLLRTLLLLGSHPAEQDAAAAEAAAGGAPGELPRLRACVQETLRLYPAVPDLIRVTRTETEWRGVRHPAGTAVLLPAHFHQRDPAHVPAAHVFVPGRWKSPDADQDLRMSPFGHGPGRCPGDRLGLLVTTALCAEILRRTRIRAVRPVLDPPGPLPTALDPRGIRLALSRR